MRRYSTFLFAGLLSMFLAVGQAVAEGNAELVVQGRQIEVNMYTDPAGLSPPGRRAAVQFSAQQPAELDAALQLTAMRWLLDDEMTGLDGLVMEFGIDAQGLPTNVQMIRVPQRARNRGRTEMSPRLRLALIKVIQAWRFKPPMQQGKAVGYCCVRLINEPD